MRRRRPRTPTLLTTARGRTSIWPDAKPRTSSNAALPIHDGRIAVQIRSGRRGAVAKGFSESAAQFWLRLVGDGGPVGGVVGIVGHALRNLQLRAWGAMKRWNATLGSWVHEGVEVDALPRRRPDEARRTRKRPRSECSICFAIPAGRPAVCRPCRHLFCGPCAVEVRPARRRGAVPSLGACHASLTRLVRCATPACSGSTGHRRARYAAAVSRVSPKTQVGERCGLPQRRARPSTRAASPRPPHQHQAPAAPVLRIVGRVCILRVRSVRRRAGGGTAPGTGRCHGSGRRQRTPSRGAAPSTTASTGPCPRRQEVALGNPPAAPPRPPPSPASPAVGCRPASPSGPSARCAPSPVPPPTLCSMVLCARSSSTAPVPPCTRSRGWRMRCCAGACRAGGTSSPASNSTAPAGARASTGGGTRSPPGCLSSTSATSCTSSGAFPLAPRPEGGTLRAQPLPGCPPRAANLLPGATDAADPRSSRPSCFALSAFSVPTYDCTVVYRCGPSHPRGDS